MMIPGIILAFIFSIVPLFGIVMAFEDYDISKGIFGSQWVDIYNFKLLFARNDFGIPREILSLSPFGKSSSIQGCLSCWLSSLTKCSIRS